jgi:acyl carrier protein
MTTAEQLKQIIIKGLNLEGLTPDEIDNNSPLFGKGLDLDSLDAVELVMLLDKHFGVRITNSEMAINAFQSINHLLNFINNNTSDKQ